MSSLMARPCAPLKPFVIRILVIILSVIVCMFILCVLMGWEVLVEVHGRLVASVLDYETRDQVLKSISGQRYTKISVSPAPPRDLSCKMSKVLEPYSVSGKLK